MLRKNFMLFRGMVFGWYVWLISVVSVLGVWFE